MDVIKFDQLMDDGVVFIWVTSAKLIPCAEFMLKQGFIHKDTICWNKFDKNGDPLPRGGFYTWHTNEVCLVFIRIKPINSRDKFQIPRACGSSINTKLKGMISQKPFQLYEFIEKMVPIGPYIELFGRKHNAREGWVTVGDEAIDYIHKIKQDRRDED